MRAELGTILATVACCVASAADLGMHRNDEWRSVPVDRVRLDGPLGRRVALTATNNLMRIDLEGAFFKPFREKKSGGGFIGLGKLLDGAVYLAKYMNDPAVTARKCEIARVLAETQDADGYIGYFAPDDQSAAVSIVYVDVNGMSLEDYTAQLESAGATEIEPGTVNGLPCVSYKLAEQDSVSIAFTTEAGYILEVTCTPLSVENAELVWGAVVASIQPAA